ncbi:hypothetical protein MP477_13555 [Chryseobacterium sp. WG23]|uniref:hypothetical protein n=1 Tax=Chryseobacterium sp. WG23 TaxID=2926910 RepID=UPI00211DAD6D|nr:hypothetical protein [Chryseobacterium sp. WG23]MCQ9635979.1 hypothetical protein [Chryseobacterium sp. WG23]
MGKINYTTEDYLYALGQNNLVYNDDFRYFSNQISRNGAIIYGIPDGWLYSDSGANGKISFDSNANQLVILKSQTYDEMSFSQALHEFPRWKQMLPGETVSAQVILNLKVSGEVTVQLSDGIDSSSVTVSQTGDHELNLLHLINPSATKLILSVLSKIPNAEIRISRCCTNLGLLALKNLPCIIRGVIGERRQYIATEFAPEGEFSLCNAPVELDANYTRLNSILNYRFGKGPNGFSLLLDMRGYFSRAWNNQATVDMNATERKAPGTGTITGDHVSTFENDIFKKHDHGLRFSTTAMIPPGNGPAPMSIIDTKSTSKTDVEADGLETRPKNIAELYTIKWA